MKFKIPYLLFIFFHLVKINTQAQQTVGLFFNTEASYNGYTLIAPTSSKMTYLIDNCGEMINSWESDYFPGSSAYLLKNGDLLRTARIAGNYQGGGSGGRIEIFNWEGDMVWSVDYSTEEYQQHHDVAYLPNGNILTIAWEGRTTAEMIEAGKDLADFPEVLWSEKIVELQPIGNDSANVVWEWHLWDHLIQEFDSTKNNYGVVFDHPELLDLNFGPPGSALTSVDWIHFNAINYNPELDQIIMSSRHLQEIIIIDHSTTTEEAAGHTGGNSGKGGDFLFRWGNPQSYQRGTAEDLRLFGPHDAQWIPKGLPDEGKIMVFNNGSNRPNGNYSTVEVFEPPIDSNGNYILEDDKPYGPETLTWMYAGSPTSSFFSNNISGAERLPNGNTLICEGRKGKIFEVNSEGNILWQYVNPVVTSGPLVQGTTPTTNSVFRAYRYGTDYPAFQDRDLTPQGPIELEPLPSNCLITEVEDLPARNEISILGNPVFDVLKIENKNTEQLSVEIFDLTGKKIGGFDSSDALIEYEIEKWKNGIYFARIYIVGKNQFFTEKIIKIDR